MIKGIIFDCFGVLYGGSAEEIRVMCPAENLDEFDDTVKQADYGYISREECIERFSQLLGRSTEEVSAIIRKQHIRNVPLVDFMKTLHTDYEVGLLSNVTHGTIEHLISSQEMEEWFDATVMSSDVHLIKPDPRIFALTAERLKLLPEECVMIDDRAENCDGARQTGMYAIQHTSNEQTIASLNELLAQHKV